VRTFFGLKTLCAIGFFLFFPTVGDSATWRKYENDYFVVYSNAREKRAQKMIEILERFRAAVVQISSIEIPRESPKTIVLLPKNRSHFKKLITQNSLGGFATRVNDQTILVMPASDSKGDEENAIRHEFAHALLAFHDFEYPRWYEEGFAELVAEVQFVNDGRSFTLGEVTKRAAYNGKPLYDWNKLVSDQFKLHEITGIRLSSSAYAQAWLLAHYTTLGNELNNLTTLQHYFSLVKEGVASEEAFTQAFGMSALDLWHTELKSYAERIPYYTINFESSALNLGFSSEIADESDYKPMFDYFSTRSIAYRKPKSLKRPLKKISGYWQPHKIGSDCSRVDKILIDEQSSRLTIRDVDIAGQQILDSAEFSYIEKDKTGIVLTNLSQDSGEVPEVLRMELRDEDILCISRGEETNRWCVLLTRCELGDQLDRTLNLFTD